VNNSSHFAYSCAVIVGRGIKYRHFNINTMKYFPIILLLLHDVTKLRKVETINRIEFNDTITFENSLEYPFRSESYARDIGAVRRTYMAGAF
jgi:hypothetical protein